MGLYLYMQLFETKYSAVGGGIEEGRGLAMQALMRQTGNSRASAISYTNSVYASYIYIYIHI